MSMTVFCYRSTIYNIEHVGSIRHVQIYLHYTIHLHQITRGKYLLNWIIVFFRIDSEEDISNYHQYRSTFYLYSVSGER